MPALTSVSTRSSAYSGTDKRPKASFFGAIKGIFSNSGSRPKQLRQRRLSILSVGSNDGKSKEDEALEQRRNNCLAIRTAKNEPVEVQRLVVDCEFCNPPPRFGRDVEIVTPQFTAGSGPPIDKDAIPPDTPEVEWNVGLEEWVRMREWWNKRTAEAVPVHHSLEDVSPEKFFVIYDKFVRHTRPLKAPMNLDDAVKLLKAGWIGDGTWPTKTDPDDRWTDDEDPEEEEGSANGRPGPGSGSGSPAPGTGAGARAGTGAAGRKPSTPNTLREHDDDDDDDHALTSGESDTLVSHVQFGNLPQPNGPATRGLKRIERTHSSTSNLTLQPTRSNTSSLVDITTDEER